jgi:hypothetical protein
LRPKLSRARKPKQSAQQRWKRKASCGKKHKKRSSNLLKQLTRTLCPALAPL